MFDSISAVCVLIKFITTVTYPCAVTLPPQVTTPMLCRETSVCPDPPVGGPSLFLSLFLRCLTGLSLKIVLRCKTGLLCCGPLWITPFLMKCCCFVIARGYALMAKSSYSPPGRGREFSSLYFKEGNRTVHQLSGNLKMGFSYT